MAKKKAKKKVAKKVTKKVKKKTARKPVTKKKKEKLKYEIVQSGPIDTISEDLVEDEFESNLETPAFGDEDDDEFTEEDWNEEPL